MNIGLIITAAGTSSRYNHSENKLFTLLADKPLILHTYTQFLPIPNITEIVITTAHHTLDKMKSLFRSEPRRPKIITGGHTRKDSVQKGFKALQNVDLVLIHDGARPLVSESLITRVINTANKSHAVIPILPMTDTIKQVENKIVTATVPRSLLYGVQTPQAYPYALLQEAYHTQHCKDTDITDEAMLIEALGHPIQTVEGDETNLKITTPIDKQILETLMGLL